jgi:hypothetical protein
MAEPGADGDLERDAEDDGEQRREQESTADAEHARDPADADAQQGDAREPDRMTGDVEREVHVRSRSRRGARRGDRCAGPSA